MEKASFGEMEWEAIHIYSLNWQEKKGRKHSSTLHDTDARKDFLNSTPFAQELWSAITKWDLKKTKKLLQK